MDGLRKSDIASVKDFLSRTNDNYRQKYGRVSEDHLRQCVFMGTVNDSHYLVDVSGGRRFWPVAVRKTINTDAIVSERDQIWAEAVAAFYAGVPWHLAETEEVLARDEQAQRVPEDSWESTILPYLLAKLEEQPLLKTELSVSTAEIVKEALLIEPAKQTKSDQMRVSDVLRRLGWSKRRFVYGRLQQNRWTPPVPEAS